MVKVSSPTIITSNVVVDDNIVTGKGMGVSIEFGLKLVEIFSGKEEAEKIKKSIVYK
jgi:4-methyl-5(b-hydroxyethyl)-thiazole monophosphate biosynthesis